MTLQALEHKQRLIPIVGQIGHNRPPAEISPEEMSESEVAAILDGFASLSQEVREAAADVVQVGVAESLLGLFCSAIRSDAVRAGDLAVLVRIVERMNAATGMAQIQRSDFSDLMADGSLRNALSRLRRAGLVADFDVFTVSLERQYVRTIADLFSDVRALTCHQNDDGPAIERNQTDYTSASGAFGRNQSDDTSDNGMCTDREHVINLMTKPYTDVSPNCTIRIRKEKREEAPCVAGAIVDEGEDGTLLLNHPSGNTILLHTEQIEVIANAFQSLPRNVVLTHIKAVMQEWSGWDYHCVPRSPVQKLITSIRDTLSLAGPVLKPAAPSDVEASRAMNAALSPTWAQDDRDVRWVNGEVTLSDEYATTLVQKFALDGVEDLRLLISAAAAYVGEKLQGPSLKRALIGQIARQVAQRRDQDRRYQQARDQSSRSPRRGTPAPIRLDAAEIDEASWDFHIGYFSKNGVWPGGRYGPAPDQPGCRAPAEILAKYNIKRGGRH